MGCKVCCRHSRTKGVLNMTLLITGATGFIGKRVVDAALNQGMEIAILTQSPEEARAIFGEKVAIVSLNEFLQGDVNINATKAIHLAWSNVQNYMNAQNLQDNLEAQFVLIKKLVSAGIKDITVAGTCLEYGLTEGLCTESMQMPQPLPMPYAKAKYELFKYMQTLPNITLKWVRCFYVYGLGQRPNSLLTMLLKAIENHDKEFNMSAGEQIRDFVHVDTLAKNIVEIAGQSEVTGIINIGSGKPMKVVDFVREILIMKNYDIKLNLGYYPYSQNEPMSFWADVSKLKLIDNSVLDSRVWL